MDRTTIGLLVFFLAGICVYLIARTAKPWEDKHQNIFWLVALSPLLLTIFVLPGHVSSNIINGIHALLAGIIACEYIRTKHGEKLNRVKNFRESVAQERKKAMAQDKKTKDKDKRPKDK